MTTHIVDLGQFSLSLPEGWNELTPDDNNLDSPITIADAETGVGALQVSIAKYKSGKLPNVTCDDLLELLDDFSKNQGFSHPVEQPEIIAGQSLVSQSFHSEDDFIQIWYASDGKSIALFTYVCDWKFKDVEISKRNMIVKSISFRKVV